MRESSRPKARHTDIVLQEIGDETLVYDLKTNKAICLNQTSSVVWRKCDGTNSITEITEFLGSHMTTEVNEELTNFAIHQLHISI